MNWTMVKRLMLKDWYLQRSSILFSIAGGAIALAVIALGGKALFMLGVITLVTLLILIGALLPMQTAVQERKEQTLAFVMSLPISYREYTAAKILGNLLIFLVPWLAFMAGSLLVIEFAPGMAHGLVPFVAVMGGEVFVSTCLIAAVAITTESQGWTIAVVMVGNLALNGVGYFVAHIPSIGNAINSPSLRWPTAASGLLLAEFAACAFLIGLTLFLQSRKKDFL